jgi:hypothetical protein
MPLDMRLLIDRIPWQMWRFEEPVQVQYLHYLPFSYRAGTGRVFDPRGSGPFSVSTDPPEPDQMLLRNMEDHEQRHVGTCTPDLSITEVLLMSTRSIGDELRFQLAGTCDWLFFSASDPKSGLRKAAADLRISPFLRNTRMQLRGSSRPGRYCRRHSSACSGAVAKSMPIVSLQERRIAIWHYNLRLLSRLEYGMRVRD